MNHISPYFNPIGLGRAIFVPTLLYTSIAQEKIMYSYVISLTFLLLLSYIVVNHDETLYNQNLRFRENYLDQKLKYLSNG